MKDLSITVLTGVADDYDSQEELEFCGTSQEIVEQLQEEGLVEKTYADYAYDDKDQFIENIYTNSNSMVLAVAYTDDFKKDSNALYF
jgi:hypothetical protein